MGGEVCYQKNKERGPWYEIDCLRVDIINKESAGKDASFERKLLRAWSKYQGYEMAGEVLASLPRRTREKSKI
jgi:hypothetical protein